MKPFSRSLPWVRYHPSLNIEGYFKKTAFPFLRTGEIAPGTDSEELDAERLTVKKLPLGSYKSGEVVMNYAQPNLVQELHDEYFANLEDQWAENYANKRKINWKILPAVYAVAAVAHTVITMISIPQSNIEKRQQIEAHIEKSTIEEKESITATEKLHTAVREYLNASTVEEKIKWVRHPERVKPLMSLHYEKNSIEDREFVAVREMKAVSAWSKSFILLSAELKSGGKQFLAVEHTEDDNYKIDWETEVCYQPISWKIFSQVRAPISLNMRVLVRPDMQYTMNFTEEDQYVCFRMVTRENQEPIYGYVKKDSPVWHDLRLFFTGKRQTRIDGEPVILRLRVPDQGVAKDGVIIERFLSDRWMYLDPPTGSQSNKAMATSD